VKPETISRLADELTREYSGAAAATEGAVSLVKLPRVNYPTGCKPGNTSAIVVLDPQQPAPRLLVKELPTLKNGRAPRSTGAEHVGGEGWYSFSFNQPWSEQNTGLQFVEGRLRRFALDE
jgi:hypothetical protein